MVVSRLRLRSAVRLKDQGFEKDDISIILQGSNSVSAKILEAITNLCIEMKKQNHKIEYIKHYVRRGKKDKNRRKVAKAYLNHHFIPPNNDTRGSWSIINYVRSFFFW